MQPTDSNCVTLPCDGTEILQFKTGRRRISDPFDDGTRSDAFFGRERLIFTRLNRRCRVELLFHARYFPRQWYPLSPVSPMSLISNCTFIADVSRSARQTSFTFDLETDTAAAAYLHRTGCRTIQSTRSFSERFCRARARETRVIN